MGMTIDAKVVEMRFDNKQFEAGAKQTINSLTKLKEALKLPNTKEAFENIDRAAKNTELHGLAAGVQALEDRFSTMGIVGMRVIENITDALMGKLHKAVNFVTDSIVSGGIKRAMNIENAHFQLQALLKDETKVQAVMADAMESVDGTAYAYDEAAKAASQFAASGIQAGEEMLGALKGITGVAAMTNSSFEDVSRIFTTVAGNGRLMGDQLLQLSSRGLNAASTLADYFKEVRGQADMTEGTIREMVTKGQISFKDFSDAMTWAFGDSAKRANETFTGAMSNMKSALARIGAGFISPLVEQNGELVQLFNALRIKINDVKSALVFDEQRSAVSGLAEATGLAEENLSEMFTEIKTRGHVAMSDLNKLTTKSGTSLEALTKYVNGVVDGSIRATYATSNSLQELTEGMGVSTAQVKKFVEEGSIDLATFTSAMEHEFGNEMTLSKQFTDFFLDQIHGIVEAINMADMTKPMTVFYHGIASIQNVLKGMLSVVRPIGKAFAEVFLTFTGSDVVTFAEQISDLTSRMKLSEENSAELHDAFKGLFDVIKLLADILIVLFRAITPIRKPVEATSNSFLGLIGALGRTLSKIVEFLRGCQPLKDGMAWVAKGVDTIMTKLADFIKTITTLGSKIGELEGTQKFIEAIGNAFQRLGDAVSPSVKKFIERIEKLVSSLFKIDEVDAGSFLDKISTALGNLADSIDKIDFTKVNLSFDGITKKISKLKETLMANGGIAAFAKNAGEYGEEVDKAFTWDGILDRLNKIMEVFQKFFTWLKDVFNPAFEDFSIGGAVAGSGGIAMIYSMFKASKSFEKLTKSIKSVPDVLNTLKNTIVVYQKQIKAESILKIAAAIATLAASLVLLSFADPGRLVMAATALTIVAGTLLYGIDALLNTLNKARETQDKLAILAKDFGATMKKAGRALEIRAFGLAMKDFAVSVAIIAASIAGLGYLYKKDGKALKAGAEMVTDIAITIGVMMAAMMGLAKLVGPETTAAVSLIGLGVLAISVSLILIITSMQKLMGMEIPGDAKERMTLLMGIIYALLSVYGVLIVVSRLSGEGKIAVASVIGMAIMLHTTVSALDKLFKMNLPPDYKTKLAIMAGIFVGIGALSLVMAKAADMSGGAIKAGGTLLGLSVFLVAVTGSLSILAIMPADKLLHGAEALGLILVALGLSLFLGGQTAEKINYKTVMAMCFAIGVTTASLGILSMIPWENLMKGAVSLGLVLVSLGVALNGAGKNVNSASWQAVMAMIVATLTIVGSLVVLSEKPWENMLASGVAMSATMFAFSEMLRRISKSSGIKMEKVQAVLVASIALLPIAAALGMLASQPWDGLLAAGAAMSLTLIAFSKMLQVLSASKGIKMEKIGGLVGACIALVPIAIALYALSEQPWEGLLASATAISEVLLALSLSLAILSMLPVDPGTATMVALSLSAFVAVLATLMVGLGALFSETLPGLETYLDKGIDILVKIGAGIGEFIGAIIQGVISEASKALPEIGSNLSLFMTNVQPFLDGMQAVGADSVKSVGYLAAMLIGITASEIIAGIANLFGLNLLGVALKLTAFITTIKPFLEGVTAITPEVVAASGRIVDLILKITVAELLSGINTFLGFSGGMTKFAADLLIFGGAVVKFANIVQNVKPDMVAGAAMAGSIMAELVANLPPQGGLQSLIFGDHSLAEFGEELVAFAPSIVEFAKSVQGISPGMVVGAAATARIMSAIANNLPDSTNLAGLIFGGNKSLKDFGEELEAFGPSIKAFAEEVQDVTPAMVTGAESVARIFTKIAENLPEQTSFADKIFGNHSLKAFGEELEAFGPSIKGFAEEVQDVTPTMVLGAANACRILMNVADNLPDQGGLASLVFGKHSLAEFGEELEAFGPSITGFAKEVESVNPESIDGAVTIAKMLSALTEEMPSTQTLKEIFFGGGQMTLSQFAAQVQSFASAMATVSTQLSGFDIDPIDDAISAFKAIAQLSKETAENAAVETLKNFADTLAGIGIDSINHFVDVFDEAGEKGKASIKTIGSALIQSLIDGVGLKKTLVFTTVIQLCADIITKFKINLPGNTFRTLGQNIIIWLVNGMSSKKGTATAKAEEIGKAVVKAMQGAMPKSEFVKIGEYAGEGLAEGINNKIDEIKKAAVKAAKKAIEAAKKELDERSPSHVFEKIGEFIPIGMANGIIAKTNTVAYAVKDAAKESVSIMSTAVDAMMNILENGEYDADPVITPVVDMSYVEDSAKQISALMNRTLDLSGAYDQAMSIASGFASRDNTTQRDQNGKVVAGNGSNTFEFNQYNYSPKALTRSEIYRQTNNQFTYFKEAVGTA